MITNDQITDPDKGSLKKYNAIKALTPPPQSLTAVGTFAVWKKGLKKLFFHNGKACMYIY